MDDFLEINSEKENGKWGEQCMGYFWPMASRARPSPTANAGPRRRCGRARGARSPRVRALWVAQWHVRHGLTDGLDAPGRPTGAQGGDGEPA
jgi:hypothetical protein